MEKTITVEDLSKSVVTTSELKEVSKPKSRKDRMKELNDEFEKGQKVIKDLQSQIANIATQMNHIQGAYQMLVELEKESTNDSN